ncbi:MAG: hypothetical protein ACYCQJ_14130 [Nitrososphaerales archaeon]
MASLGWNYQFPEKFSCEPNRYHELLKLTDDIIDGLRCLYKRSPINSILREIIYHVRREAQCLRSWLKKCRRYVYKTRKVFIRRGKQAARQAARKNVRREALDQSNVSDSPPDFFPAPSSKSM